MSDGCDTHGERAKRLIKAWSAIEGHEYDFEDGVRIPLFVGEKGYTFSLGRETFSAESIDGAFSLAEVKCREICAVQIKYRREALDKAMRQQQTVEEILR